MSTNDKIVKNVINKMNDLEMQQQQVAVSTLALSAAANNFNALKYSMPFYISPASLFNNHRLKRQRRKWIQNDYKNKTNYNKKKTDSEPSLTINLLSDDEDEAQNEQQLKFQKLLLTQQQQTQQMLQSMYLKAVSSTEPPPLVPISKPLATATTLKKVNTNLQHGLLLYSAKNKTIDIRPTKKLKANTKPMLLNAESIVLSDDSDPEFITTTNNNKNKSSSLSLLPELTLTAIKSNHNNNNNNNNNNNHHKNNLNNSEEEVTVSLVPRHAKSSAQHLKKQQQQTEATTTINNVQVFPMLPDETIVHTVIANRTYELSLTKLREGLAQGEQTSPSTKDAEENLESTQAAQISLKLSSDLSISLISDEEDDSDENSMSNNERARLSAEQLRRQQPQLTVQQVNLCASTSKQPPKRRKLG